MHEQLTVDGVHNRTGDYLMRRSPYEYAAAIDAGQAWYATAHEFACKIAAAHGLTVAQSAGIIAAASINATWDYNQRLAWAIAAGNAPGMLAPVRTRCAAIMSLPADEAGNVDTIKRVLMGEHGRAFKIANFGDCIARPHVSRAVAIDRWIARIYGLNKNALTRVHPAYGHVYYVIAAGIRACADEFAMRPHEIQAALWALSRGRVD